jgi:plasmid stabilization system protein ParE
VVPALRGMGIVADGPGAAKRIMRTLRDAFEAALLSPRACRAARTP